MRSCRKWSSSSCAADALALVGHAEAAAACLAVALKDLHVLLAELVAARAVCFDLYHLLFFR